MSLAPVYALAAVHHDNSTDTSDIKFPIAKAKRVEGEHMHAIEFHGDKDVRVAEVPRVTITEPGDVVVHISSTTICGSDLHLYHKEFLGLHKGDILGHEGMGIITEVGPSVTNFKVGDRVVISCIIACGSCHFCKEKRFGCCDVTNSSKAIEKQFGHRPGALFGYSDLLGGYDGCQASYVRVPFADVNCLKVPSTLRDEQVLFLSDILCTAWHANELGEVKAGDQVIVWGCGPVGLLCAFWAKFRGAARVISIDSEEYRLEYARAKAGAETIDRSKCDVVKTVQSMMPGGPDVCIDATGFRFATGLHKVERAVGLETDTSEIVNEMITVCNKGMWRGFSSSSLRVTTATARAVVHTARYAGGRISLIADYYTYTNHFNIGAFMEKGLMMRGGQVWVQKYWQQILSWIEEGRVDASWLVTHHMSLKDGDKAYTMFDKHEDRCLKILLHP